jgi:glycosyltransferase involved in cell wall biosynthesis
MVYRRRWSNPSLIERMDIFYILNSRFPTIKAYGLQVAKARESFKQAGARVRLIVPIRKRHREIKGIDPFTLYAVKDPFRIIKLPSLDFSWFHLDSKFFFMIQQATFALLALAYLTVTGKHGVIYSRDQFSLYVLSFFRSRLFWEVHTFPEHLGARVYRRLLAKLSGIIVISRGLKDKFVEHGYPVDKLLVAPDGIDPEEFTIPETREQARARLKLPLDKKVVMYVGHLFEWKGADTLVRAASELGPDIQVVIGGGTQQDVAKLRQMDHAGRVRFEGFIEFSKLPLYLRAADILILPNKKDGGISEFYTSPLKLFAYMAAGRPIIASDLPSLREAINEDTAFFVRPDDSAALAARIIEVAGNPEDAASRAQRAQQAVQSYAWKRRGSAITEFIKHRI